MATGTAVSWPMASIGPMRRRARPTCQLGPYTVGINSRILATYKVVYVAIFKVLRVRTDGQIRSCVCLQRGQFKDYHRFNHDRELGSNSGAEPRLRDQLTEKMQVRIR